MGVVVGGLCREGRGGIVWVVGVEVVCRCVCGARFFRPARER